MCAVIHGEHIPVHLSFAACELVNGPENMIKDIHRATKPQTIHVIHNEYLPRFIIIQSKFHFLTIRSLPFNPLTQSAL